MRAGVLISAGLLACALPAQAKDPVIVELYTSQGCGACADAGRLVDDLAAREDLLPLTFSVDYWDYLGWKDTFARPEFSDRQQSYADRWAAPALYTPQVVVAGLGQTTAGETEDVEDLIEQAAEAEAAAPRVRIDGDLAVIGAGQAREAHDVWLIRYDPRGQDVIINRGENRGRTLSYRNVVRELVRLGEWSGHAARFDLPPSAHDGLSTLIVVQAPGGGPILSLGAL